VVSFGNKNEEQIPPPTSVKQLEDVLQDKWYKILLETVQNCPRKTEAVLKAKGGPTPY
jgi:hypothetical protein